MPASARDVVAAAELSKVVAVAGTVHVTVHVAMTQSKTLSRTKAMTMTTVGRRKVMGAVVVGGV